MADVTPDPQRVAILLRSLDCGGMQRNVINLGKAFLDQGCKVDLLVATARGVMRDQIPPAIHLLPLAASSHLMARAWPLLADPRTAAGIWPLLAVPGPRMFRHLHALTRYLRERPPAALLALGTQSNLAALWARSLSGAVTRIVVSEHNAMSAVARHARRRFRRAYPRLAGRMFLWADGIVAVSNGVAEDLAASLGLPSSRITTIHNPLSPDVAEASRAPLHHPWLAQGSAPVILAVGRLHRQKDFATLLEAFARVRAVYDARLVILGEGGERERLAALAHRLGVAGDVLLPGFAPNPYAWMARARVFVLSSILEGFGNVVCEALACGCPVVSTDCPGGPREILDDGAHGRLVPVGDDRAMARAILAELECRPDPGRLRARAAKFTVAHAANRYLDLLLGRKPHG